MRGLCCFQGGQRGGQNSPDIKRYQALRAGAVAKCTATREGEGRFRPRGNVHQNGALVNILPTDLPRNERQIRPLIEQLEHNGERLKVWADVVATGEKPTQRLVEAKIAEFKASGVTVPDFDYEPVADLKITSASGRVMYNAGENDECYTPAYAVKALIPYIHGHHGDYCRSLACGESWAVRLASIVDGHERTDDLADDIDHVMAENPDCFSPEQIAAAFQMQRREATR